MEEKSFYKYVKNIGEETASSVTEENIFKRSAVICSFPKVVFT